MSTTTIRLAPELKKRVAQLARQTGQSAHNCLLGFIADGVSRAEARADFAAEAHERFNEFNQTGRAVAWEDMKAWLLARGREESPPLPRARRAGAIGSRKRK